MKAIVCTKYGSPDLLRLEEMSKPAANDNQVLVKVLAAALNAADVETLRGEPIVRLTAPFKPMIKILGSDIAGQVEAIGKDVTDFQPGDEVWGGLSFLVGWCQCFTPPGSRPRSAPIRTTRPGMRRNESQLTARLFCCT